MSVSALEEALRALQIHGDVVAHGRVAVLITAHPEQLVEPAARESALRAAGAHGFRTLAVELPGDAPSAHVPGA
jgi:hypothetical protein